MSGKPDDDLPGAPPAKTADDVADDTLDLGIAEIMAALSVEALMEEALEKALAQEKEAEAEPAPPATVREEAEASPDDGDEAASHEDVLQAGPAGDEMLDEELTDLDLAEGFDAELWQAGDELTTELAADKMASVADDADASEDTAAAFEAAAPSGVSEVEELDVEASQAEPYPEPESEPEPEPEPEPEEERAADHVAEADSDSAPLDDVLAAEAEAELESYPDRADSPEAEFEPTPELDVQVAESETALELDVVEAAPAFVETLEAEGLSAPLPVDEPEPDAVPQDDPAEDIDAPAVAPQLRRTVSRAVPEGATEADIRFMAAAIRLSRRHLGLTSTNPSVGTLIVKDGRIVGRGVTALGGRPHAETQALAEAGAAARGATAYVTLEPCAHHGRTPPCAEALVAAGIARVVGAAADPDDRVSGRGYAILRAGGIEVIEGVLAEDAADLMAGYLSRSARKRPEVTLKLALSADNMIGRRGIGQVQITGGIARTQVHMMRSEADAILVGVGTVESDNPELNVRLPGLEDRSPIRIVLDREARLPMMSKLALSARSLPLYVAVGPEARPVRKSSLEMLGVRFLATETHQGRIALPELLEDLAGKGIASVLVEGGAATAATFLEDDVVDRIVLFRSPNSIGADGIASPITPDTVPADFRLVREARFGVDQYWEWTRD